MHCFSCKTTKTPLSINSTSRTGRISHVCRECNTARVRKYRETESGRKTIYKAVYKSIKKHQDRQDARYVLNKAVRLGTVTRPEICPVCNETKKVEAHHTDYSKPLEVSWLCRTCHSNLHRLEDIHTL